MSTIIDSSAIFNEIITRLEEEAAFDRDAYYDMVEEVLEEKRTNGQLSDDDDLEGMQEELKTRWPDAEASFSSGHDQSIDNDA